MYVVQTSRAQSWCLWMRVLLIRKTTCNIKSVERKQMQKNEMKNFFNISIYRTKNVLANPLPFERCEEAQINVK